MSPTDNGEMDFKCVELLILIKIPMFEIELSLETQSSANDCDSRSFFSNFP